MIPFCQRGDMTKPIIHSQAFPACSDARATDAFLQPVVVVDGDQVSISMPDGEQIGAQFSDLEDLIAAGIPVASWGLLPSINRQFNFIDLQTEAKMILNSHPAWCGSEFGTFPRKPCLDALGVSGLPDVLLMIAAIHAEMETPWCVEHAIGRGDYLQALEKLRRRSSGLPLDVDWWSAVLRSRNAIRAEIAASLAGHYPGSRFWRQDGPEIKFDADGFAQYVDHKGWARRWPRTADGRLMLDRRTLDDQTKVHPELKPFKEGKAAMDALKSVTLNWDASGCVLPGSTPFHTKTGRNQPRVKDGFVFAMPSVFRVAGVRPAPGRALVVLDWSKQEPAIGIGMSGDESYRTAYQSGDLYLECARRSGAVPMNASKATHPEERQTYKAAMLGIGYGMGEETLGNHIFADVNTGKVVEVISRRDAAAKAREVVGWYRSEFNVHQTYLDRRAQAAQARRWCASSDGWIAFVSESYGSKPQLINFPVQSEGAVMLRRAVNSLAFETDLDVVQTLHDAIYLNCDEADVQQVVDTAREHMDQAARSVTDVPIDIDVKVITHRQRLVDPRADKLLPLINKWL